jgi:hypothetical protein
MVAVIFHQGFVFRQPAVMEHLLSHEADEYPAWSEVSDGIELAPWAQELAQTVLKAPAGEWFLTLAAGLHYMAGKPDAAFAGQGRDDDSDDSDGGDEDHTEDHDDFNDHESDEVRGDARDRKEAGADWMAGQGFDRKD